MVPREAELREIKKESKPLLFGRIPRLIEVGTESFRARRILKRTDVNPIKQFEVEKHTFLGIPTGMEGTLVVDFPNRSFFQLDAEIYIKAVSSGFKWIDRTFSTTLSRRNGNRHKFHWEIGFWEAICRTFWALVSDETTCKGYIKIGGMKKEFDVTKEIPIEKEE